MLPWWRKPGNHASATMPCQQLPSPTLPCFMAGVRWSSPSLLINTRGGTSNLREEFWGNQRQILGVGIFWRREERPVEKKNKGLGLCTEKKTTSRIATIRATASYHCSPRRR
jgi:hypothetical protein